MTTKNTAKNENTIASKTIEKYVKAWKTAYLAVKGAERLLEGAKERVLGAVQAAGGVLVTKSAGTLEIRTRTTITSKVDVEAMLRADGLTEEAIKDKIAKFTVTTERTSAPFIEAPRSWSADAKLKEAA